eukprot:4891584-Pyramimonas_sp.AAC.1
MLCHDRPSVSLSFLLRCPPRHPWGDHVFPGHRDRQVRHPHAAAHVSVEVGWGSASVAAQVCLREGGGAWGADSSLSSFYPAHIPLALLLLPSFLLLL